MSSAITLTGSHPHEDQHREPTDWIPRSEEVVIIPGCFHIVLVLSVCLSVSHCLSVCLSLCLFVCPCIHICLCLSVCLSVFFSLSFCLSVCPCILCLCVCQVVGYGMESTVRWRQLYEEEKAKVL